MNRKLKLIHPYLKNKIKFDIIIVEENEFKISFQNSKNEMKNKMKMRGKVK